ncbi:MAG: ABC transporter permease subunit, partial [Anaerolineales bacterium]
MDLQDVRPKSQAELIFEAQLRKDRQFRANVALSWIVLLGVLVLIFSGKESLPFGIKGIQLDTQFIAENWSFIASGIWSTIGISLLSITFATLLALFAALGRLSTFPPYYAVSTFYVSLIRGTPLYLQIFFFFLALPQLGIVLPGLWAGVLALGLNYGAYMSEIFRAGLAA